MRRIAGRRGSKRGIGPVGVADLAQDVEPGGIGKRQVEQEQVGLVVAAEPKRVGGTGGGKRPEPVGHEVLAEQLQGRGVVLADDDGGDLSSLGQHCLLPVGRGGGVSPTRGKLEHRESPTVRDEPPRAHTPVDRPPRPPAGSRKSRSSGKRMPKVCTFEQRGINKPLAASSRSRWGRAPSSRARKAGRDRHLEPADRDGRQVGQAGCRSRPRDKGPMPGARQFCPELNHPRLLDPEVGLATPHAGNYASRVAAEPRVAVFGPHPMLSITVEALTSGAATTSICTPPDRASGWRGWRPSSAPARSSAASSAARPARAAAAARGDGRRAAAGRDRRGERLLPARPPQRRARADRPERRAAASPA